MTEERNARIRLPRIYQDHMMLQRDKILRIRGEAAENVSEVTVELTDETGVGQKVSVKTDGKQFACDFPAQPAGTKKILLFYVNEEAGPEVTISDVSIGDIWMACGQSNMEYFLRYDAHWNDLKNEPFNENVHMFNVPRIAFEGQERDFSDSGYWFLQGDPAWPTFSTPGYCFAREVQEKLDIPVGVIGCNWGGTPAAAWMKKAYLEKEPLNIYLKEYEEAMAGIDPEDLRKESLRCWEFKDSYRHQLEWRTVMYGLTWEEQQQWVKEHEGDPELPLGPYHHYRPGGLYQTMLRTFAPFPIKGILWYQGESDNGHAEIYDQLMQSLVQCFRDTWADASLPFLYVQLAPYARWLDDTGVNYPAVRESQQRASKSIPYAWMTSIMDLGDHDDIHPKYKREVGQRLALLARGKVYGEDLLCEPPEAQAAYLEKDGTAIRLSLLHAQGGLRCGEKAALPFMIQQNGQKLDIESVSAEGEALILNLPNKAEQGQDIELSFAETPYCEVQIWNQAGLPLKPFHCTVKMPE